MPHVALSYRIYACMFAYICGQHEVVPEHIEHTDTHAYILTGRLHPGLREHGLHGREDHRGTFLYFWVNRKD